MKLTQLPEVTFVSADVDQMDSEIVATVEEYLGRTLSRADPLRLFLRGVEQILIQQRLLIDEVAKQNLLSFARGSHLDHLGALVGVHRLAATSATVTMKLTLSAARLQSTTIAAGTRFTAGNDVYFALDEAAVFASGVTEVEVAAHCTATGIIGNDYAIGEINQIADPQPFLQSAVNVTKSEGGSDVEDDDTFRERIHEAPESFSVAGPTGAYEYFAKSASALISDVAVTSPQPGHVNIYPLLKGGIVPETEILDAVYAICNDKSIRPLTDFVTVLPPTTVNYSIQLKYFIDRANSTSQDAIIKAVNAAIDGFISWQRECLGRDINPTELIYRIRAAGAKRVEVTQPTFTVLAANEVAIPSAQTIEYGGLEDG